MRSDKANIKIKLDDSILQKINSVDKAVANVEEVHKDVNEFNQTINEKMRNLSWDLSYKVSMLDKDVTSKIKDIDEVKQDKLVAGDHISIDPETNVISSIGGDWSEIEHKPTINGVELESSKNYTTEDLGVIKADGAFYDEDGQVERAKGKKCWYLTTDIHKVNEIVEEAGDNFDIKDVLPYLISDSEGPIPYDFGKGGGGGGGGGGDTDIRLVIKNYSSTVSLGNPCLITINWVSTREEVPTGPGSLSVAIDGTTKYTRNSIPQGDVTFDIGQYLTSGANKVSITVTDAYDNRSRMVIAVTAVEIELTSTFDPDRVFTGVINYTYTPIAAVTKTIHFIVDGEEYGTDTVTVTGEQQTYQIVGLSHGSHTLDVYFTCIIDESEVISNTLSYDLMFEIPGDPTPIITSTFNDLEQEQYVAFNIPYRVYTPGYNYSQVQLIINGEVTQSLSVNQDVQYWEYRSSSPGDYEMKIKTGVTEKVFNVHIARSEINVQPVSANLALFLTSYGRSNSEAHPEIWEDAEHGIRCNLSGFNFSSDGWLKDTEGNTVMRITGDARVEIPYQPFKTDFRSLGRTIEIEFATSTVKNYETNIISCWSGDRGFYITPQLAKIKSQQSELQTQYKEDDHVRIAFVIEKISETHLILMYINGIMSGAFQYPIDDNWRQLVPVNISLGSSEATLDIYNIRIYDNNLNRKQVVNNWIADTQNGDLKAERFYNNDVFNDSGEIVASRLSATTPYIIWDIDPLPQYKGDKRKGQAYYRDPSHPEKNFTLPVDSSGKPTGDYNVQGTSSAVYPVKNIRLKSKGGFIDDSGATSKLFYITEGGIGANYFTYKVDYASSESANNVELVKLYNDAAKAIGVLTPPQREDSRVRVGIDGFPIVAFHRDANGVDTFTTKANFNNDKANEDVYGFADGDESWEITNNSADEAKFKKPATQSTFENAFEIRFPDEDGYSDISKLGPMTQWVCSTDPLQATYRMIDPISFTYSTVVRAEDGSYSTKTVVTQEFTEDTPEYRKAKFKAELKDHFNVDSTVFYYIFTHLFLMVDSRAKNAFPTYFASRQPGDGGDHWFWLPYDMDTALGINNEGKLVFNYDLEDTDQVEGADVFNGQNSVMWCNLREMFDGEIGQMYAELRKSGNFIGFDEVEARFINHQKTWSENIFNEDSYKKYIVPLVRDGDNYLEMLQGSKAEQRRWWLYNRFKYFDSKYLAGDAKSDVLQFRAYDVADITITPYADIYATVSYMNGAAGTISARAKRGTPVTLHNPLTYANDQETYIYSASQMKSVGDLSPFKPDTVKAANAVKLQELKIGDASPSYTNPNLKELTLGKNILLSTLDVRNCINLTQAVDISNCSNIEHVYFDGTKITGIRLPEGGILKTLHLPDTLSNITIKNQMALTDLRIAGTENVQTLWLENIPSELIDAVDIISHMPEGAAVRLIGFSQHVGSTEELKAMYDLLDTMAGLNAQGEDVPKAQINGSLYIDTITYANWVELSARYPDVKIVSDHIRCTVEFINDGVLYNSQIIDKGNAAERPEDPTKESTAQYYYVFEGWDTPFDVIEGDTVITAEYSEHIQVYEFKFDTQTTKVSVNSQFINYGEKATRPEDPHIDGTIFEGWFNEPEGINPYDFETLITGPKVVYARWTDEESPIVVHVTRDSYKTFKFEIRDNIAVTKYAVTRSSLEPEEWIDVVPVEVYDGSYDIDEAGSYYVWGSDAAGLVASSPILAYRIKKNVSPGASIELKENDEVLSDFALQRTTVRIKADKDSHYDDLKLYVDEELSENPTAKIIEGDVEVKATCVPHVYEIQFDLGGMGVPEPSQQVEYLHKVEVPRNQFVTGYIIDGWYREDTHENRWDFNADVVSEDMTLYARWIEYVEPSRIRVVVGETKDFTVSVWQSLSYGVEVDWGDGAPADTLADPGYKHFTHTYAEEGEYEILITCVDGTHRLGHNSSYPVVKPASSIIHVEFAWNMAVTQEYAFYGASNLIEIELTNYMTEIAGSAFEKTGLTSIVIPDNILAIKDKAFAECRDLVGTVTLPKYLRSLGRQAFYKCSAIEHFVIPDTLSEIDNQAFQDCISLLDFEFPSSLTYVPNNMLQGCSSLTHIEVPETVEMLAGGVFNNCENLEKVILKNPNLETGYLNFGKCPKLVTAGPIGGEYNIEFAWDKVLPALSFSEEYGSPILTDLVLPDTLEEIGDGALQYCANIHHLVIPRGLKKIGASTFERMTGLLELDIPFTVSEIGRNAFAYCFSVQDFYLRNTSVIDDLKVQAWPASWFRGCNANSMIHVPSIMEQDVDTRVAYGEYWNYRDDQYVIPYTPDIFE